MRAFMVNIRVFNVFFLYMCIGPMRVMGVCSVIRYSIACGDSTMLGGLGYIYMYMYMLKLRWFYALCCVDAEIFQTTQPM